MPLFVFLAPAPGSFEAHPRCRGKRDFQNATPLNHPLVCLKLQYFSSRIQIASLRKQLFFPSCSVANSLMYRDLTAVYQDTASFLTEDSWNGRFIFFFSFCLSCACCIFADTRGCSCTLRRNLFSCPSLAGRHVASCAGGMLKDAVHDDTQGQRRWMWDSAAVNTVPLRVWTTQKLAGCLSLVIKQAWTGAQN